MNDVSISNIDVQGILRDHSAESIVTRAIVVNTNGIVVRIVTHKD